MTPTCRATRPRPPTRLARAGHHAQQKRQQVALEAAAAEDGDADPASVEQRAHELYVDSNFGGREAQARGRECAAEGGGKARARLWARRTRGVTPTVGNAARAPCSVTCAGEKAQENLFIGALEAVAQHSADTDALDVAEINAGVRKHIYNTTFGGLPGRQRGGECRADAVRRLGRGIAWTHAGLRLGELRIHACVRRQPWWCALCSGRDPRGIHHLLPGRQQRQGAPVRGRGRHGGVLHRQRLRRAAGEVARCSASLCGRGAWLQ